MTSQAISERNKEIGLHKAMFRAQGKSMETERQTIRLYLRKIVKEETHCLKKHRSFEDRIRTLDCINGVSMCVCMYVPAQLAGSIMQCLA